MGINNLTYSKDGLSLTEQFEGLQLTAYQDQRGVWTIGYGHTGPDVYSGLTITQQQAEDLLAKDVAGAAACVNECVAVPLQQDEFDALVDFAFNCGPNALRESTLLIDLNASNYDTAAEQFLAWDRCNGSVVAGLFRRRQAEENLYDTAAANPTKTDAA
jgi:lysozyme